MRVSKRQKLIFVLIALAIGAAFSIRGVAGAVMAFLVAGQIPGTHLSVPFWVMMAGYCAIISLLVTYQVENAIKTRRQYNLSQDSRRMPRRRFGRA